MNLPKRWSNFMMFVWLIVTASWIHRLLFWEDSMLPYAALAVAFIFESYTYYYQHKH